MPLLINEMLLHSKFTKKEVKQIIMQSVTELKQYIMADGMRVAMKASSASFSKEAAFTDKCVSGIGLYDFYNNLLSNYNHNEVKEKLNSVVQRLFNKKNVKISLSGDEKVLSSLTNAVREIKLPRKSYEHVLDVKLSECKSSSLIIPAGISYNSLSFNLENINERFKGSALVLTQIVNYDYLWAEIRVKGGAYGCGLSIGRNNNVSFGSYRDPNVVNTYKVFNEITSYLDKFNPSKEEFNSYVIGSMSSFDAPLSTPSLINAWDINYINGYTSKDKKALKKEI